jgi:hypothetical protein
MKDVKVFFFFFAHGCLVVPVPFVEKTFFSMEKIVKDTHLSLFLGLSLIPSPISHCTGYCSLMVGFEAE